MNSYRPARGRVGIHSSLRFPVLTRARARRLLHRLQTSFRRTSPTVAFVPNHPIRSRTSTATSRQQLSHSKDRP
jgi:hypothetical protein